MADVTSRRCLGLGNELIRCRGEEDGSLAPPGEWKVVRGIYTRWQHEITFPPCVGAGMDLLFNREPEFLLCSMYIINVIPLSKILRLVIVALHYEDHLLLKGP